MDNCCQKTLPAYSGPAMPHHNNPSVHTSCQMHTSPHKFHVIHIPSQILFFPSADLKSIFCVRRGLYCNHHHHSSMLLPDDTRVRISSLHRKDCHWMHRTPPVDKGGRPFLPVLMENVIRFHLLS